MDSVKTTFPLETSSTTNLLIKVIELNSPRCRAVIRAFLTRASAGVHRPINRSPSFLTSLNTNCTLTSPPIYYIANPLWSHR